MNLSTKLLRTAGLALVLLFLCVPAARAQSTLYWTNSSYNWNTTDSNWETNSAGSRPTNWVNGDNAVFSVGSSLTNSYTLTNGGVTVNNITLEEGQIHVTNGTLMLASTNVTYAIDTHKSGAAYDLQIDSHIADSSHGASSINKTGTGILLLGGSNSFSGGVTLSAGILSWQNSDHAFGSGTITLGSGSFLHNAGGDSTLTNAIHVTGTTKVATHSGNVFIAGPLTGSGTFDVSNNSNDFDGLTIPSATILITTTNLSSFTGTIAHDTLSSGGNRLAFGLNSGTNNLVIDASNAKFNLSGSTTGPNSVELQGNNYGIFKIGELEGSGGRLRAGQTSAGNTTFEVGYLNTSSTFSGIIANYDTGSAGLAILTKVGTGTLTLNNTNTYTGGTTVAQGELTLSGGNNRLSTSGAVTISNGATLNLSSYAQTVTALNGAGAIINSGGLTVNTATANTFSGSIGGNGGFTKNGAGTMTLSGANTYNGNTTVNAGKLIIDGTNSGTGTLSIAAGATLGGTGTIAGATTISGTHTPGNSPGVQTFSNGLTYATGSTFVWELIANTDATDQRGVSYDGVNVSGGSLTISTNVASSLVFNSAGSAVSWTNSFWGSNQSWLVFSNATTPSGLFDTIALSADMDGLFLTNVRTGASFSWSVVEKDVYLNYTAVPEPSTYALLAVAGIGALLLKLRRQRNKNTTV